MNSARTHCAALLCAVLAATTLSAEPRQAAPVSEFLDSIGVCTHLTFSDTPYGRNYDGVRKKLIESGIRHTRDIFNPYIDELAANGIKTTIIAEPDQGTPDEIAARVKQHILASNAIAAVEGPHQPDIYWPRYGRTYQGRGFPEGAVAFQRDLYTALKQDEVTSRVTVIGMAFGDHYGRERAFPLTGSTLAEAVDWGNCHTSPYNGNPTADQFDYGTIKSYYANANFPSVQIDEFPALLTMHASVYAPKPLAVTNTGYPAITFGISSESHGKYVPRLFAENFRLGIKRTYLNEFVDSFEDREEMFPQAHFGLLQQNLTPKPGYASLQSLIATLKTHEPRQPVAPATLDYEVIPLAAEIWDRAQDVHHLLLQGRKDEFLLMLWHEVSNEDISVTPHRQIDPPPRKVHVTFAQPVTEPIIYQYGIDWRLVPSRIALTRKGSLELMVDDQLMIVRLKQAE